MAEVLVPSVRRMEWIGGQPTESDDECGRICQFVSESRVDRLLYMSETRIVQIPLGMSVVRPFSLSTIRKNSVQDSIQRSHQASLCRNFIGLPPQRGCSSNSILDVGRNSRRHPKVARVLRRIRRQTHVTRFTEFKERTYWHFVY